MLRLPLIFVGELAGIEWANRPFDKQAERKKMYFIAVFFSTVAAGYAVNTVVEAIQGQQVSDWRYIIIGALTGFAVGSSITSVQDAIARQQEAA